MMASSSGSVDENYWILEGLEKDFQDACENGVDDFFADLDGEGDTGGKEYKNIKDICVRILEAKLVDYAELKVCERNIELLEKKTRWDISDFINAANNILRYREDALKELDQSLDEEDKLDEPSVLPTIIQAAERDKEVKEVKRESTLSAGSGRQAVLPTQPSSSPSTTSLPTITQAAERDSKEVNESKEVKREDTRSVVSRGPVVLPVPAPSGSTSHAARTPEDKKIIDLCDQIDVIKEQLKDIVGKYAFTPKQSQCHTDLGVLVDQESMRIRQETHNNKAARITQLTHFITDIQAITTDLFNLDRLAVAIQKSSSLEKENKKFTDGLNTAISTAYESYLKAIDITEEKGSLASRDVASHFLRNEVFIDLYNAVALAQDRVPTTVKPGFFSSSVSNQMRKNLSLVVKSFESLKEKMATANAEAAQAEVNKMTASRA